MVERESYLEKIRPYYHKDVIKIFKGVRRCGKTVLLNNIIDELKDCGIDESHIIVIDFDLFENSIYVNTSILTKYIKSVVKDKEKYYIFFDEIQNIKEWEKIVCLLNYGYNLSIFVTGSSSDLLNSKYTSYLENYICFDIFPYTFKELCDIKGYNNDEIFEDFLKWGAMPLTINMNEISKKTYIGDVYNSIIIKDIVERFNVKDVELLNKIISYIFLTLSESFSVNSMAKYFETYDRKVSLDTMYNYLEYINSTFMINKVERYNVIENRVIYGKYKYYLTDINFANALNNNDKEMRKYRLENAIYNELVRKGYDVYQAVIGSKEIDFVALKDNKRVFIQVGDILADNDDLKSIYRSFNKLNSNDYKYILSLDKTDLSYRDIKHINIKDFLINNEL